MRAQGGHKASRIAAGANHSLALSADGQHLWGWGNNECGQIGDAVEDNSSVPVKIELSGKATGEAIVDVSAGYAHTAVQTASGAVFTFGRGENGQLGHGTPEDTWYEIFAVVTSELHAGGGMLGVPTLHSEKKNRERPWHTCCSL